MVLEPAGENYGSKLAALISIDDLRGTVAGDGFCQRRNTKMHFHDLRHEATSRLFEKGLNMMEVASITGYEDLKMLKRYTHLRAEDLGGEVGLGESAGLPSTLLLEIISKSPGVDFKSASTVGRIHAMDRVFIF